MYISMKREVEETEAAVFFASMDLYGSASQDLLRSMDRLREAQDEDEAHPE
jgi:hypothetical protein